MGRIAHLKPGETMETQVTTIHYETGVWWKRLLNGLGAIVTGIVLIVLVVTKFTEGAWVVVVAIPLLVLMFRSINNHYAAVAQTLSTRDFAADQMLEIADVAIVPIGDMHRGTLRALGYAQRLSPNVRAVCICTSEEMREAVQRRWNRFLEIHQNIELVLIDYEYRDILTPLVEYIQRVSDQEYPGLLTSVVIPEFVPDTLPAQILHNQTAVVLRQRLRRSGNIVLIDVPFQVHG